MNKNLSQLKDTFAVITLVGCCFSMLTLAGMMG